MRNINKLIDKKLEYKLIFIENKLKNSFHAIKQDNQSIRDSLGLNNKKIEFLSQNKVFKSDFEQELKKEMEKCFNELRKNYSDLSEKIEANTEEIQTLEKNLSEKDIKGKLKKELSQELKQLFSELSKKQKKELKELDKENARKLEKNFKKYNERVEYLKKEFIMFKNEFVTIRESLEKWKKDIGIELKEVLEEEKKENENSFKSIRNQVNSLKTRNTILNKELNSLKRSSKKLK
jgi:ParB family transcriptional regulator, chromosome partitioning protein